MFTRPSPRSRSGFTLVELLVVIAIIGILVALLLPAIQAAREAARRTECTNHLKQFITAVHNHHDVYKIFPTGGTLPWANAKRFAGNKTDPGWAYQILPFMEQKDLYEDPDFLGVVQKALLPVFFCPSRRAPTAQGGRALMDYAGATPANSPTTWDFWQSGDHFVNPPNASFFGLITRSADPAGLDRKTTFASVSDGASNVLALGEKQLRTGYYATGDWHDDCGWTDGWDPDIMRYTGFRPYPDQRDQFAADGNDVGYHFGSAHPAGFLGAMGDGAVRMISFDIDATVFNNLGHRSDGAPIPEF